MISSPHSVHELVEVVRSWAFQTPPSHRPQAVDDALAGIEEQLEALRDAATALYERVEMDESVGVCLSSRFESLSLGAVLASNPASAPDVDGLPCKGTGADYLVEQDNSNPANRPDWATGEACVSKCVFCQSSNVWEIGRAAWKCADCGKGGPGVVARFPASGLHALTTADAENEPVDVRTDDDFEV